MAILNAEDFKHRRKALGYTREALGKLLGISERAVAGYERGEYKPKKSVLLLFSKLTKGLCNDQ